VTKQANRNPIKEQEEEQDKKFNGKKALKKVIFFKYFFFLSFVSGEKNYNNRRVEKEKEREIQTQTTQSNEGRNVHKRGARAIQTQHFLDDSYPLFFNSFYLFVGGSGTGGRVKRCYYLINYYCYCNFNIP
jgi:CRISPR/Cas system CSM-associated protein Csm4 (group 5 of RAMP superfamily)